jgi:hypothetical protein
MITRSRQTWEIGHRVKVGFMSLTVTNKIPTPGNYEPDAYTLSNGKSEYVFVPHKGLFRIADGHSPRDYIAA